MTVGTKAIFALNTQMTASGAELHSVSHIFFYMILL